MALSLKPVPPARGMRWVGDAFRLFRRRPLGFLSLFAAFIVGFLLFAMIPWVGQLAMMALPLLSLGFMVAAQSALLDGPVRFSQYIEPLRTDARRRRALLILCAIYGAAMLAIVWLANGLSEDALGRLQALISQGAGQDAVVAAMQSDPGLRTASTAVSVLGTLLTIPFWHAAALVHWGGQGVLQALFSSTLAVWRARWAFTLYGLTWFGLAVVLLPVVVVVSSVLFGVIGAPSVALVVVWLAWAVFWSVFYISVLFTFNDSFGGATPPPPDAGADGIET